jgi:hypothetical protein
MESTNQPENSKDASGENAKPRPDLEADERLGLESTMRLLTAIFTVGEKSKPGPHRFTHKRADGHVEIYDVPEGF